MSPPETREARPPAAAGGGPGTSSALLPRGDDVTTGVSDQPTAHAVAAVTVDQPCPGRRLWQYRVVDRRGHVHLHRCGPPTEDGHLRTAPCGETYLILVGGAA
jgi:hypothetical protein